MSAASSPTRSTKSPSPETTRVPSVAKWGAACAPSDFYSQSRVSPWDVEDLADIRPINIPETYNSFVPPTCICKPEPGEAPPPPDTDENLLKIYRAKLAPCFPFVLVPDDVSATTLGATRPFLMAAIRMVSSYRSMKSMRGQMYRLLNHVADHMLLRSERSFDLLLGISMDIHQIDSMRYSGYMQQCLRELEDDVEYESDIHLGYIVRIQRLCERISDLRSKDYLDEEGDESTRAPLSAYVSGFRAEWNKLQTSMPPTLKNNAYLQVRMATLRLRIHEPPRIDAELLASLSKSLDSISAGSTSALDAFYQSNAALKGWFETWLSVPQEFFYCIPISIASHMVYAVMMMSRWSWLTTRGKTPPEPQTDPTDPSQDNPNVALAAMEAAISPNTPASTSTPSAETKGSSPWQTTLPDKDLPQVLAALKARLSTQPDLMLDVEGYLNRIIAQLQTIDALYSEMSVDEGEWRGNIWSLGATKVKIAMLRQQRWSKIIASQAEERELEIQGAGGEQLGLGEIEMQENFLASLQMPEWDARPGALE
ncbi:uncharacterized protein N0V96_000794 [Colletotrichum fioriniae]|uniref:uncharacterized protein n=1 Tax=Colletotrichum fioriniae TaxID=710243 RepID=UPI0032D9C8A8|nr:hypothetical protein N0V96_000794 [Colletotrichum fioriniae]